MNKKKYLILDCFVDEPACFGVPPFISPYPRYLFGALVDAGIEPGSVCYSTIDAVRETDLKIADQYAHVFVIGGAVVPGRYLGEKIGTVAEINRILELNSHLIFVIGGPIREVIHSDASNAWLIQGDIEQFAYTLALDEPKEGTRDYNSLSRWAVNGSQVVTKHPDYPHIICEMETYRGCPRQQHCSFCYEGGFHNLDFRPLNDIVAEVDALISHGVKRFRLGRQADILQYQTRFSDFRNGFPRPEQSPVLELFSELKSRRESGAIQVLNIDNANPGTIANFPAESTRILEGIVSAITPGDTLALGFESFDPQVIQANNLKVNSEEAVRVLSLVNEVGGKRVDGIPVLLPGINLVHGLIAENHKTFQINYNQLQKIAGAGLLVKRINIRKLVPFPGTLIANSPARISKKVENRFDFYRNKIRSEIDTFMLKKLYPVGTIIKDNFVHEIRTGISYGKQIASYSITVKFPLELTTGCFHDALIVGHSERSVTGLPVSVDLNTLPARAIECIPGIGKKRLTDIVLKRPFKTTKDLNGLLDGVPGEIISRICVTNREESG